MNFINENKANPKKALTVRSTLQSFVSESIDLKYLAQRAFISYMRFVFLSTDKVLLFSDKFQLKLKLFRKFLMFIK